MFNGTVFHPYYHASKDIPKADILICKLAVPEYYTLQVIESYHDFGHQGFERCYHAIILKCYWPAMSSDVYQHVQSCQYCQQAKHNFHAQSTPLNPLPITGTFSQGILASPTTLTPHKNTYILVVVDSFSKCEAFPMKIQEVGEVAQISFSEIIVHYGAMDTLTHW